MKVFAGKVAIITGGASGIGRALGEELACHGCEVVLSDLQVDEADAVAAGIRAAGGKATAVKLDVTDFTAVDQLVRETVERCGRVDYMFNNAGIAIGGEARYYEIDDWDRIIDVNLRGVTNGVQATYRVMLKQGFGHIVNTASLAGLVPSAYTVAYSATKHAIVGLSKSLRAEAASAGVRVSVVCPGVIKTPILDGGKYGKVYGFSKEESLQMWERLRPMDPNVFAHKVLCKVARNKAIIIVPFGGKIAWWINRLSPSLGIYLAQKMFGVAQKKFGKGTKGTKDN